MNVKHSRSAVAMLLLGGAAQAQQERPSPVEIARAEVRDLAPSVQASHYLDSTFLLQTHCIHTCACSGCPYSDERMQKWHGIIE